MHIKSYSPATGGGDNKPSLPKGSFAQQFLLRVLSYITLARRHSGIINNTHEWPGFSFIRWRAGCPGQPRQRRHFLGREGRPHVAGSLCLGSMIEIEKRRIYILLHVLLIYQPVEQSVTFRFRDFSVLKLFQFFGWYRIRYRKKWYRKKYRIRYQKLFGIEKVSDSVLDKFVIEKASDSVSEKNWHQKSIRFGIGNIWYWKKYRIRYRKNLV